MNKKYLLLGVLCLGNILNAGEVEPEADAALATPAATKNPPFKAWDRALCNELRNAGFTIDTGRALFNPKTKETIRGGDVTAANMALKRISATPPKPAVVPSPATPPFKAWDRALCNKLRDAGFTIDTGRGLLNPKTGKTIRGGDVTAANMALKFIEEEKEAQLETQTAQLEAQLETQMDRTVFYFIESREKNDEDYQPLCDIYKIDNGTILKEIVKDIDKKRYFDYKSFDKESDDGLYGRCTEEFRNFLRSINAQVEKKRISIYGMLKKVFNTSLRVWKKYDGKHDYLKLNPEKGIYIDPAAGPLGKRFGISSPDYGE
ncbi:MAG: hypothetical protein LBS83_02620 [Holosporales bacterium]|jgi:hypothetical protein|nr:hypothetical protein [Holosporales bacterium]